MTFTHMHGIDTLKILMMLKNVFCKVDCKIIVDKTNINIGL